MKFRERIGTIVHDEDFATLFAKDGKPGLPPWRLALVTILQFHEHLSDRQAAQCQWLAATLRQNALGDLDVASSLLS